MHFLKPAHPFARLMTWLLCLGLFSTGCVGPQVPPGAVNNPLMVHATNYEGLWENVVDVLHDYHFNIARENRLEGVIETEYKVGSGLLEPWHRDSVGAESRLESTLQSIRRRVIVNINSTAEGGMMVGIQVFKELENLDGVAANSAGGATFQESQPFDRDLNLVVGQTAPSGWQILGRDLDLERALLADLQNRVP